MTTNLIDALPEVLQVLLATIIFFIMIILFIIDTIFGTNLLKKFDKLIGRDVF